MSIKRKAANDASFAALPSSNNHKQSTTINPQKQKQSNHSDGLKGRQAAT